jgi:hypothetical protein
MCGAALHVPMRFNGMALLWDERGAVHCRREACKGLNHQPVPMSKSPTLSGMFEGSGFAEVSGARSLLGEPKVTVN